jgi:hypothetical protein
VLSIDKALTGRRSSYCYAVEAPFYSFLRETLSFGMPWQRRKTLGGDINVGVRLFHTQPPVSVDHSLVHRHTSTVSRTLITPGWRSVLSLRRALRASGRRDLLVVISKEKTLHFEPSSYSRKLAYISRGGQRADF